MKKFTKILALVLAFVLAISATAAITMALLTDEESAVNVMTVGNVYIDQYEQERVDDSANQTTLKDFTQGQMLLPAWYQTNGLAMADAAEWPAADAAWSVVVDNENVIDKFVTVKNTGTTSAYVRTVFAVEVGTCRDKIHLVTNEVANATEAGWAWEVAAQGVKIDGADSTYDILVATYTVALAPGETTIPSLKQVYLDVSATNEDVESFGSNYEILVVSQAVQSAGFGTNAYTVNEAKIEAPAFIKTALNAAFKAVSANAHPWSEKAPEIPPVITNPDELKDFLTDAGAAGAGDTTLVLAADVDLTGQTWTPVKVDGYHGADIVTIDGNGHTIKGLTAPLFAGGFAGGSGIVIKNLTIADSNIVSTNTIGSGAFIESCDSMAVITLQNCHLLNSTVTGGPGSRTGGLLGWTAGYNKVNDGPVKTYVTIEDCSVIGSTIQCDGSVGGIYGHAGNNEWTYSTVKNCIVKDCNLDSTDDGGWRVGVVVGTANVGELTISGITESGNTLTQTGKSAPAGQSNLYGRFVPGSTGKLVIDGVAIG